MNGTPLTPTEAGVAAETPAVAEVYPAPPALTAAPLTVACQAFGLLAAEGLSVGLCGWALRAGPRLLPYTSSNDITARGRLLLLASMIGTAALACVLGAVYLVRRRRPGLPVLSAVARRLCPLIVIGFVPFLLKWTLWSGRDLTFLAIAALLGFGLQRLLVTALAAPPIFARPGPATWLRGFRHRMAAAYPRLVPALPTIVVVCGALFYAIFFGYHTVANHRNILTSSLDLGLEDNLVWNALHGGRLFKSSPLAGPDGSHFGYHVTFFAYVIAGIYFFAQRAETLLILQAILLGGAAVPLYLFARRHLGPWKACLIALLYLLYAPLHGANLYDFHYLPLGPFFLWTTLYALEARRPALTVVAVILTLSVREDVAAGLGIVGAYLLLSGQRPKAGIVVAAIGTAYFVALKLIIMPLALKGSSAFLYMFTGLLPAGEGSFGGVLKTVIGNPPFAMASLVERDKLIYILQIMTPLIFLPLRRPIGILCCLPGFVFTLLSTGYTPLYQISFQYTAHWTTYLFIAVVVNLAWLGRQPKGNTDPKIRVRQTAWLVALSAAMIITSYQYGAILQQNTARGGFGAYKFGTTAADRARRDALYALIRMVPPRAKIVASENVVPHVSTRPDAYTLRHSIFDAEYLLFILPNGGAEATNAAGALSSGQFGVVEIKEPFVLAKRGHSTDKNRSVLSRMGY